jgi:glutamate racemase
VVKEVMGPSVRLIDSAQPTVAELGRMLRERDLLRSGAPEHQFFVTDASYKFMEIANGILGRDISELVRQVKL